MAILIKKQTEILGNINVNELYLRFDLFYDVNGEKVNVTTHVYPSKSAYDLNSYNNSIHVNGIADDMTYNYNRSNDGVDLLLAMHNKIRETLTTDRMKTINLTDPSTGNYLLDPSTGNLLTEEIISKYKFAEDSSIVYIDIE